MAPRLSKAGQKRRDKAQAEEAQKAPNNLQRTRAAELLEKVDKSLTSTVNGEFFEGTKSSNDARHRQLPGMFELRAEIQELRASEEKRTRADLDEQEESAQQARKAAIASNAQRDMVGRVVETLLQDKFRDVNIKYERLEGAAKKAEGRAEKAEARLQKVEMSLKKAEGGIQKLESEKKALHGAVHALMNNNVEAPSAQLAEHEDTAYVSIDNLEVMLERALERRERQNEIEDCKPAMEANMEQRETRFAKCVQAYEGGEYEDIYDAWLDLYPTIEFGVESAVSPGPDLNSERASEESMKEYEGANDGWYDPNAPVDSAGDGWCDGPMLPSGSGWGDDPQRVRAHLSYGCCPICQW